MSQLPRLRVLCLALGVSACSLLPAAHAPEHVHRTAIVVDTHADTTPWFEDPAFDFARRQPDGHMDLPRMREGGLDVQFWSIYMGRREGDGRAIREALERIDAVYQMAAAHADETEIATRVSEIRDVVRRGKIASLMGIEGGHIIEGSLPALRMFHALGVRYMTLTHSFNNRVADSSGTSTTPPAEHGGLSPFGRDVVEEMNRLGMMIDVSHVSDDTFWDVIETTRAPIIASHSSARAVADHIRNMSDDMLRALAENGGVVMINFYPAYIDTNVTKLSREHAQRVGPKLRRILEPLQDDPHAMRRARRSFTSQNPWPQTSVDVLLDHFDHAIAVAGPDHVGIGADMDGVPSLPKGLDDVSKLPVLTTGLLARGHSVETVRKVLGENLLRVMKDVEDVSGRLR